MADPKNKGAEARARYAAGRAKGGGYNDVEFININLTDAQNEDKAVLIPDYQAVFNRVQEEVENGYRFTVKWDERGNCVACFMQCIDPQHDNAGFILAGRGRTASSALRECLYIHSHVLGANWQEAARKHSGRTYEDDF